MVAQCITSYLEFKLNLELAGIDTFQRDEWVQELYKKYLKEDQSDYRKTIRRCIKVLGRHR